MREDKRVSWYREDKKKKDKIRDALNYLKYRLGDPYHVFDRECGYGLYHSSPEDCVSIIVAGGAGDGPMWAGMVGEQLADGAVFGEKNCAPNAYAMYEMGKLTAGNKGVLFLVNNYMGDYLNTDMAVELLQREGILAKGFYSADDMCSAEERKERGGLHGIGQLAKLARLFSSQGRDIHDICYKLQERQKAISSCSVLLRGEKFFVGEGFSGEQAYRSMERKSIEEVVESTAQMLFEDIKKAGESKANIERNTLYMSLNYNRSLSYMEGNALLQLYRQWGLKKGIKICRGSAGCYFDVYSDWGWSITFVASSLKELEDLREVNVNGFLL